MLQTRARAAPWVCFPGTFLLLSSEEDSSGEGRGGPCPRPLHKGPAQPAATVLPRPRRCPFRAAMRGVSCNLLLGETSGLRGPGRELVGRGQEGQGQAKPAHLCAPEGSQGCQVLMGFSVASMEAKREKLRHVGS